MNSSFFSALHEDANAGKIADFARAFEADDVHVSGRVEHHDHFSAHDACYADGSANLESRVGFDEFDCLGTNLTVSKIEVGLLFAGVMLGDGEIGIRADAQDGAVIESNARASEVTRVDHVAPENLL